MSAENAPESALQGLLTCGNCGEPMTFEGIGPKPQYACRSRPDNESGDCGTPDLDASATDALLLSTVFQTVMTERNIGTVLESANRTLLEDGPQGEFITRDALQRLVRHPSLLVQAAGGSARTRLFLRRFISNIEIHPERAIVRYSLPLPADSPLPRKLCQEIELLPEALT